MLWTRHIRAMQNQFNLNLISLIQKIFEALPFALAVGFITGVIIKIYEKKQSKTIPEDRKICISFFSAYIFFVLHMAITSRPIGTTRSFYLVPFIMPDGMHLVLLYSIANIIAFLPLGIMIPIIWNRINKMRYILLIGFLISITIEIMQFILKCGISQTEDVLMNTLGTIIGYKIYKNLEHKRKG